ncbi:MAG: DUF937 domain-containing protein [Erythrobacter sp.]|nr:DUF937 domain-containing protein [Erythrobacter sp.]
MNLSQVLQQSGVIESMARELGIDEQTARVGAGALLPAIVAGMGRQTTSAAGSGGLGGLADVLGSVLGGGQSAGAASGGTGGLSGGLGGALGSILLDQVLHRDPTPVETGNDILGQIFGSREVSRGVAEEVAGSTGISSDILKRMLPILAMAVVGYMMNRGQAPAAAPAPEAAPAPAPAPASAGGGVLNDALGAILGQVVAGLGRR